MNEIDIAWFAGLFEGEGSFVFHRGQAYGIQLPSTDKDVLERIVEKFGGGVYNAYEADWKPGWKACYVWRASAELSWDLVELILPYLCERRHARAMEWQASREEVIKRKRARSDKVTAIKAALKEGKTQRQVAADFSVSQPYVAKVNRL